MYVETSAIIAILKEEEDAGLYHERLASAGFRVISVVGKFEAAISLSRIIDDHVLGPRLVDRFCQEANIATVGIDPDMYQAAIDAFRRYGKGTGHPARLNFGDCFSYAYAKQHGLPLLYKGSDFSKTDVQSAI
jgi:ribonuclease VapC